MTEGKSKGNGNFGFEITGIQNNRACIVRVQLYMKEENGHTK